MIDMSTDDEHCEPKNLKMGNNVELKSMEELREMEQSKIFIYIEGLHKIIKRYNKKICKYQRKLEKQKELKEAAREPELKNKDETGTKSKAPQEDEDERAATAAFSFVDEMRQTAERAQNINNFVYEPTSGLYYDQKSGYYYNAATKGNSNGAGVNDDDQTGDGIDVVEFDEWGGVITDRATLKQIKSEKEKIKKKEHEYKRELKKSQKKMKKRTKEKKKQLSKRKREHKSSKKRRKEISENSPTRSERKDFEDGELSTSCSGTSTSESRSSSDTDMDSEREDSKVPVFRSSNRFQDIAKKYPPSLRIIIQETDVNELKVGTLNMITYKGGSLGREGSHDVIIADSNVSKNHLKFHYDIKSRLYKCVDLGSRNGTILNGKRMSESKIESPAHDLVHGSVIQIGLTKLLCHVHEGNSTCGLCEPGLLIETPAREVPTTSGVVLTHKEQLKKLQKKYGLENEKFVESKNGGSTNYNDRAAMRRIKVGSSTGNEKTEVACVNTEISSTNKGFKMLSKLGWNKGEALGKTNTGDALLEPLNITSNEGKKGFGCDITAPRLTLTMIDKKKLANLQITKERYNKSDIFYVSDDSN